MDAQGVMDEAGADLSATLTALLSAAEATKLEETEVRREAAARIAGLEKVRVRAYRRHHFIHLLGSAAASATDRETALAAQESALASRLDWEAQRTPEQREMLGRLTPVMERVADACGFILPPEAVAKPAATSPETLVAALGSFEHWFSDRFASEVWQLFDRFTPDSPAVDF